MEQAEKDAYKKDYNSRLKAHRISVKELYGDSEQQLRLIIRLSITRRRYSMHKA